MCVIKYKPDEKISTAMISTRLVTETEVNRPVGFKTQPSV